MGVYCTTTVTEGVECRTRQVGSQVSADKDLSTLASTIGGTDEVNRPGFVQAA